MKKLMCSTLVVIVANVLFAQAGKFNVAMPSPGISAYGSTPDGFAFQNNASSLVNYERPEISIFSEQRFMLSELRFFSTAAAFKIQHGWMGISLDHFGGQAYKKSGIGMAYARKLGRVSLGVKFNYTSERSPGNAGASAISAQTGMLISLTPKLNFGWQVDDFPATTKGNSPKVLPMYRAGIGYMASANCLLGFEIIKQENFPVNIHAGIAYTYRQRFFFRAGTQSATGSYYGGGGWALKKLQVHVSVSHHPYLGFSPGVLLNHKF